MLWYHPRERNKNMEKILLYGSGVTKTVISAFSELRYCITQIPRCKNIDAAVSTHPDMLFSVIGERSIVTDAGYFEENREFFSRLAEKGVSITLSERRLAPKYPSDVLFDAIRTEKLLVGNLKHTAPELFADNIKQINVKQGYALCSTLLLSGAAVSADLGICSVLRENGYDVLQISAGGILLDGYGYGFIGGASAVLEREKTVFFFGNVHAHPYGESIVRFCREKGYKVCCDENTPLADLGGVKII